MNKRQSLLTPPLTALLALSCIIRLTDLVKTEEKITKLEVSKNAASRDAEAVDAHRVVAYVRYFMEHLHEPLLDLCNPTLKAQYFSAPFDKAPTFEEIKAGTQKESLLPEVNELFLAPNVRSSFMVISP